MNPADKLSVEVHLEYLKKNYSAFHRGPKLRFRNCASCQHTNVDSRSSCTWCGAKRFSFFGY